MATTPPRLLILAALRGEVEPLYKEGRILTDCHRAPSRLYELYLGEKFLRVGWTAMGPENAARFAAHIAEEFPTSLAILTGYAGSTSLEHGPGTLIAASEVRCEGKAPLTPNEEAAARAAKVTGAIRGPLLTLERIITKGEEKAALAETGALAIDMETHAAAGAFEAAGVPWISLRVVLDTPAHSLEGVGDFTEEDGGVKGGALAASLLRRPALIGRLMKLGSAQSAARRALIPALEQLVLTFG